MIHNVCYVLQLFTLSMSCQNFPVLNTAVCIKFTLVIDVIDDLTKSLVLNMLPKHNDFNSTLRLPASLSTTKIVFEVKLAFGVIIDLFYHHIISL